MKAQEFANYLLGKQIELSFDKPTPVLSRDDSEAVRQKILSLTLAEAMKYGLSKSTFYDLRKHAYGPEPFKIYRHRTTRILQSVS